MPGPVRLWGLLIALFVTVFAATAQHKPTDTQSVVAKGNPARPWTYWWWMGSAVNEADITHQLGQFAQAGLGGVHIIPIYGVKGYESQFIPFLSDRWLAVFGHTVREANRLGLGVDLTTGTGWPFGGPNVTPAMAARQWTLENGRLVGIPTRQQVKRAAPGGEGPVLDPFSELAMRQYLRRFDSTLTAYRPRAMYNDSYEVYGANWTTDFPAEFQKRRGYDLASQQTAFLDTTGSEASIRVRQDYHQTLADLLHDEYARPWTSWAQQQGYQTRYQAHGSPGNLLDLYALSAIPETESFGSSRFPVPGLRVDENYEVERFGTPHPLAMKFASSAAHLTGKRLVSSETGTWLADHFKVSLSQIKPQIDELFTAGINHVFYHGITYSPRAEGWPVGNSPGWLFYASTNYGPSSHLWPHLPLLNQYVERCQTRLQASQPDNDVLVYFPIHDLWATCSPSAGGVHMLEVHHTNRWLLPTPYGRFFEQLWQQGVAFDYASDLQLANLTVQHGLAHSGASRYRVIVVPPCRYLPEATARQLLKLTQQGVRVVFAGSVPEQVPGFFESTRRTDALRQVIQQLRRQASVRVATDVVQQLDQMGIRREKWADTGLTFIRKRSGDKRLYFVANLNNRFRAGWLPFSSGKSVNRYDPLTGASVTLPTRRNASGQLEMHLTLAPGQSCFLYVRQTGPATVASAASVAATKETVVAIGEQPWQLQFMTGRPALTSTHSLPTLVSWTTVADSAAYFWGTARYSTTFNLPASANPKQAYTLDLGDVREVAEVRLNGQPLGTAWCLPFTLTIPAGRLRPTGNRLEMDVTNLSANYLRLYDARNPGWKKFYDINLVDIRYRPFNASQWSSMPSGLLGPVRLVAQPPAGQ